MEMSDEKNATEQDEKIEKMMETVKGRVQRIANALEAFKNGRMKGLSAERAAKIKEFIESLWVECLDAMERAVKGTAPKKEKIEFDF
jgi:hypothetical protein